MILGHLSFHYGYKREYRKNVPQVFRYRTKPFPLYLCLTFFILLGVVADLIYNIPGSEVVGLWVIAAQLMAFDLAALIIMIYTIITEKKTRFIHFVYFAASLYPIYDFAINVKGSRSRMFYIALLVTYLIIRKLPRYTKAIKICYCLAFIVGSVLAASISEYRESIRNDDDSFKQTNYLENFLSSFEPNPDSYHEIDLGNAAHGMAYCSDNWHYSFGIIFIDRLLFNYVPARIVGDNKKESLYLSPSDMELENKYTDGVATMTGYYEAFNSFGYLGIILFYFLGMFMGHLYRKKDNSPYSFLLYFFNLIYINIMISHGMTYFVSNAFFCYIFILPLIYMTITKFKVK